RARETPHERAGVPADGARLRSVPAPDPPRRRCRRHQGTRHVRAGNPQDCRADSNATSTGFARGDRGDTVMSGDVLEAGVQDEEIAAVAATPELPQALPVLPLKETVVFPESMTPLAIGQERSIKLIGDVVAGERLLALVT